MCVDVSSVVYRRLGDMPRGTTITGAATSRRTSPHALPTTLGAITDPCCQVVPHSTDSCHNRITPASVKQSASSHYNNSKCRKRFCSSSIVVPPLGGTTHRSTLTILGLQCLVLVLAFRINVVLADCWYDSEAHAEGAAVGTAEPCLNCTCTRGALLCYLRICPQLPNPPPSGCILLHRHRVCCPELICTDPPMGNQIEARSDSEYNAHFPTRSIPALRHACISNGTIYAPGSAMDTSSQCEYCYCLGGEQHCVRPKCLAPLDGCIPRYDPSDCCPMHYNCTQAIYHSTTTADPPAEYDSRGGCVVERIFYPEGHKVLGFGHSICDNCYCIRGMIRCEPLLCAPALFGCLPVIKVGECCPASYNCSGTIETHPLPNYGQFPVVSKEYAKLRKETQYKRTTSKFVPYYRRNASTENTNRAYYVLAESQGTQQQQQQQQKLQKDFSYTESSRIINIEAYTRDPYYVSVNNTKAKSKNDDLGILEITYRPKHNHTKQHVYHFSAMDHDRNKTVESTLSASKEHEKIDPIFSVDLFLDGRINRGIESSTENVTTAESTPTEQLSTMEDIISTAETTDNVDIESTTFDLIVLKTILNSTECVEENNSTSTDGGGITTLLLESSTTVTEAVGDAELRNAVAGDKSDMMLLNNLTRPKEDYDYDYAEPTLPPSLPNLRIIPFVAADALESKNDVKKSYGYAEKSSNNHQAEEFPFAGIFSPPAETEGGFIPKEPLILAHHDYYTTTNDNNHGALITNPVPAITNAPTTKENSCIVDGRTVTHEESITSEGSCQTCVCYFGSLVCHEPECPAPKPGCTIDKNTLKKCCPKTICDGDKIENSTSSGLSIIDGATVAEGLINAAAIRTEVAPNLPQTNKIEESTTTTESADDSFSLDKVWKLLFSTDLDQATTTLKSPATERTTPRPSIIESDLLLPLEQLNFQSRDNIYDNMLRRQDTTKLPGNIGLLKLAGCNIYGRMYRVGRIISELSGPCLECKCTETGVQCHPLLC